MSQYFDNDASIKSVEKTISFKFKGRDIYFTTDNGVFSKSKIDEGSIALLKAIASLNLGKNILDLGCAYGAIGLTLAITTPYISVVCADVNTRALALCKKNVTLNKLDDRITCLESDIYQNIKGKFDSIVLNPPIRAGKKIIYRMFEEGYEHLIDGGSLFIVIRKSHGALSAQKFIEGIYGNCSLIDRDKGYYIYQARKQKTVLDEEGAIK